MFYLSYVVAELRRRKGRTVLTALGLGVGVGLVVAVSALSNGLDQAQGKVLKPLTGVGTDMSVTRPLTVKSGNGGGFAGPPGAGLSAKERKQLRQENGGGRFGLSNLGKAGSHFSTDQFMTMTQLTFPASETEKIARLDGVKSASLGLTLNVIHLAGRVPKQTSSQSQGGLGGAPGGAPGGSSGATPGAPRSINIAPSSITGVDQTHPDLAAIAPAQIARGRYFSRAASGRQMILNVSYAERKSLGVGDHVKLKGERYTVVGLAKTPLGGQSSDMYIKLGQLQRLSGRTGRSNVIYVRATSTSTVAKVSQEITKTFAGSQVTTSKDLADRVGGSLVDAKNLSSKLGTGLAIVALIAAFLIASLLTLSSVSKRTRELGTLKALGWRQWRVVRQVTIESVVQGALGGVVGALIGVAGAALISAIGFSLKATVAGAQTGANALGGGGGAFGQGSVSGGSTTVGLDAPVDAKLVLLAIALALLGGLLSGAAGGARAARLRPADALRHIG